MNSQPAMRVVTFRVGADLYAADIFAVERVIRYEVPRSLPNMPDWIEGVLEYGGRVLPVLDFRRRFGVAPFPPTPQTRLLVLTVANEWIAAVVDQVFDVRVVEPNEMAPPPPLVRGLAGAYLRGVIRRDGALVVVLDIERVLGTTERLTLGTIAEPIALKAAFTGAGEREVDDG